MKSSIFGVVFALAAVGQWPWLASDCSVWNGTLLSIVQISSVLIRNTKALGFCGHHFVNYAPHYSCRALKNKREFNKGHNFFKVFP